jgi:methionine synthase I (cobalamin-dependent)
MCNLDPRGRAVHRSFVDAGADLILTNSFGGNGAAAQPTPAPDQQNARHDRRLAGASGQSAAGRWEPRITAIRADRAKI